MFVQFRPVVFRLRVAIFNWCTCSWVLKFMPASCFWLMVAAYVSGVVLCVAVHNSFDCGWPLPLSKWSVHVVAKFVMFCKGCNSIDQWASLYGYIRLSLLPQFAKQNSHWTIMFRIGTNLSFPCSSTCTCTWVIWRLTSGNPRWMDDMPCASGYPCSTWG